MLSKPRRLTYALPVLVAILLVPVYVTGLLNSAVGYYHDDAIYVSTAKALAEGRGYRLINLPGEPPQTKYPILFPGILAIVWRIYPNFPNNVWALKLVPLVATMLWLICSRRLLIEGLHETTNRANWIIVAVAASPTVVFIANSLLADSLFALLTGVSLLFLVRAERQLQRYAPLIAGAFVGLSLLTKVAAGVLIGAGVIVFLLRRRVKDCALFILAVLVIAGPWFFWIHGNGSAPSDPYNSWQPYFKSWTINNFTPVQQQRIVTLNVLLASIAPMFGLGAFGVLLSLLATIFASVGLVRSFRVGNSTVSTFIMLYVGMLILWPWPPLRFLATTLPIFWSSVRIGGADLFEEKLRPFGLLLAIGLFVGSGMVLVQQSRETRALRAPSLIGTKQLDWTDWERAVQQIKFNTDSNAVLVSNLDPAVYLYTGRKAIRGFQANPYSLYYSPAGGRPLGTVEDLVSCIKINGVTHLLDTPDGMFGESPYLRSLFLELDTRYPGVVRRRTELAEGYRLLELDTGRLGTKRGQTRPN